MIDKLINWSVIFKSSDPKVFFWCSLLVIINTKKRISYKCRISIKALALLFLVCLVRFLFKRKNSVEWISNRLLLLHFLKFYAFDRFCDRYVFFKVSVSLRRRKILQHSECLISFILQETMGIFYGNTGCRADFCFR